MAKRKLRTTIVEKIKGKRGNYGAIYQNDDGRRAYLAWRSLDRIFRSGNATISDAIRKKEASWAIDEEHLLRMRTMGIKFVGVLVKGSGDIFLTKTEYFFDRTKSKFLNYEAKGGSAQRYLPLSYFRRKPGKSRL